MDLANPRRRSAERCAAAGCGRTGTRTGRQRVHGYAGRRGWMNIFAFGRVFAGGRRVCCTGAKCRGRCLRGGTVGFAVAPRRLPPRPSSVLTLFGQRSTCGAQNLLRAFACLQILTAALPAAFLPLPPAAEGHRPPGGGSPRRSRGEDAVAVQGVVCLRAAPAQSAAFPRWGKVPRRGG